MQQKLGYTNCKITNKKIPILFDFGNMPIANSFSKFVSNKNFYKMKVAFNEQNGVFQLVSAPKPKQMFHENYAFLSSTSNYMKEHFKNVANSIKKAKKIENFQLWKSDVTMEYFLKILKIITI